MRLQGRSNRGWLGVLAGIVILIVVIAVLYLAFIPK